MKNGKEEFMKLLAFADKKTDWKVNLDTTNEMVADAFINSNELSERRALDSNEQINEDCDRIAEKVVKLFAIPVVSNCAPDGRPLDLDEFVWWCPNCKVICDPHNVTNDERHGVDGCMCKVV